MIGRINRAVMATSMVFMASCGTKDVSTDGVALHETPPGNIMAEAVVFQKDTESSGVHESVYTTLIVQFEKGAAEPHSICVEKTYELDGKPAHASSNSVLFQKYVASVRPFAAENSLEALARYKEGALGSEGISMNGGFECEGQDLAPGAVMNMYPEGIERLKQAYRAKFQLK